MPIKKYIYSVHVYQGFLCTKGDNLLKCFQIFYHFQIIDGKKTEYTEHLPLAELQRGLKSGKYLQGSFQASRENYLEAMVSVHDEERMVSIHTYFCPKGLNLGMDN